MQRTANNWIRDNPRCSCSGCASAGLDGNGDRMSRSACSSLNTRAYNINNPVCTCSGCASAGLSGDGTRMSSGACSNLNARAYRINNPTCSCPNCATAGISGHGTRMSRSSCTALNASADQWLRDNPVCSCSGCGTAGLSGNGERMSTTDCQSLNSRAWNINNPVCSCVNCDEANVSPGHGDRMSRSACQTANQSANEWIREHPTCVCNGCSDAGLSGAGTRMTRSECEALNTRAYNINNPECVCANCAEAGVSGAGTRMSPSACQAKNSEANTWIANHPHCTCNDCGTAGLTGAGTRMTTSECQALNTHAYEILNPYCVCSNCKEAGVSGAGTRMSVSACTAKNAEANQWIANHPYCACSDCSAAGLSGAGKRKTVSECQDLNTRAYEILNPYCTCANCETAGISGAGDRMSKALCAAKNASADQWIRDNPICSCSECSEAGLSSEAAEHQSPEECQALNTRAYNINHPECACPNCDEADIDGAGDRMSPGECAAKNTEADQWIANNPHCTCNSCGRANLDGDGDRMTVAECQDLQDRTYEILNPKCVCPNCDEAGVSGVGTRMSPASCDTKNIEANDWILDHPHCTCSDCSAANISNVDGKRMTVSECDDYKQQAYENLNPVCSCPDCVTAEIDDVNGKRMSRQECDDFKEVAATWVAEHPPCSCTDCGDAGLTDDGMTNGSLLTESACEDLNTQAYNILHPKCICPDCVTAEMDGNDVQMTRQQCDDLKELAATWLEEHPPCGCSKCSAAGLTDPDMTDGVRMTPRECRDLNNRAIATTCNDDGGVVVDGGGASGDGGVSGAADPGPTLPSLKACTENLVPVAPSVVDKTNVGGDMVTLDLAGSSGNPPLSYTLTPIPNGLTFDSSTGTVAGTIAEVAEKTTLHMSYKVSDSDRYTDDVDTASFLWHILAKPVMGTAPPHQTNDVGDTVESLTLPEATQGEGTYFLYTLPPGLSFDASSRTVSGKVGRDSTATYPKYYPMTYGLSGDAGTGSTEFSWTINNSVPELPASLDPITIPAMVEMEPRTLGEATGGNGMLTYTVWGLPAGLTFNSELRQISGTPTTPMSIRVAYDVVDEDGDPAWSDIDFTITNSVPRFSENALSKMVLVDAPVSISMPSVSGGDGPLSYTAGKMPSWLSFSGTTLSGTHASYGTEVGKPNPHAGKVYTYSPQVTAQDADTDGTVFDSDIVTVVIAVHEGYECYTGTIGRSYPRVFECADGDRYGSHTGGCDTDMVDGAVAPSANECRDLKAKHNATYLSHLASLDSTADSLVKTDAELGSGEGNNEVIECTWERKSLSMGRATRGACREVTNALDVTWVAFEAAGNYPKICDAGRVMGTRFRFIHFSQSCPGG